MSQSFSTKPITSKAHYYPPDGKAIPQLQDRTPKAGATFEASLVIRELLGVRQTCGAFSLVSKLSLGMLRF